VSEGWHSSSGLPIPPPDYLFKLVIRVYLLTYKLLIVSAIPVYKINEAYYTLDLWLKDLDAQLRVISELCLVCPVLSTQKILDPDLRLVPSSIRIVNKKILNTKVDYQELVHLYDVTQIAANRPFWLSGVERKIYKNAHAANICCIAGISSNRARTTILNAKHKSVLKIIKSWIIYFSINFSIHYFTKRSDGIFLVGSGLLKLINPKHTNIFVNTASWISDVELIKQSDFSNKVLGINNRDNLRICVAARLEHMKGVHVALDALKIIKEKVGGGVPKLLILGEGEELEALKAQALDSGLDNDVLFGGVKSYPDEFFNTIREYDLMLLTNLNDEQPRLVFDSISQGVIPICPNSDQFKALDLGGFVYYKRGSAAALAEKVLQFMLLQNIPELSENLHKVAATNTIDTMHKVRSEWIKETIINVS